VVSSPCPAVAVAGGEQGFDLWLGEVADDGTFEALGRDRQDPGDALSVLRVFQGRVAEQRVNRRKSRVAGPDAVAALEFQVVQEGGYQGRIKIGEVQPRGRESGPGGGVAQQQPQGVAVGRDGVLAGPALPDQPVGEEGLKGRREQAHRVPAK